MTPDAWAEFWRWAIAWFLMVTGGAGGVVALSALLGRQLLSKDLERFKSELSKDVERFRADLQHESEKELARLRATLEKEQVEHQERFRWLQAKRGGSIERVYDAFVAAASAIASTGYSAAAEFALHEVTGTGREGLSIDFDGVKNAVDDFSKALQGAAGFMPSELDEVLPRAADMLYAAQANLQYVAMVTDPSFGGIGPTEQKDSIEALKRNLGELTVVSRQFVVAIRGVVEGSLRPL